MVTVTYLLFVIPLFVQGAFARAADPVAPEVVDYGTGAPKGAAYPDYYYTTDYGKPSAAYVDYTTDYGKPSAAYVDYTTDYGKPSAAYADYSNSLYDYYAYNDYDYYHYYQDYSLYDDDYLHEYGEYFGYGDRNNPLDTALGVYEDAGVPGEVPWVYIIVPVLQVDLYYVDDEQKGIENIDMELPIETFLFELGDFGLGHMQLGDFGLGELQWDDHLFGNYGAYDYALPTYDYAYEDFPVYGNYPHGAKPQMFDYAEQLDDGATMDYPAVDYQPLWMDWIFMVPPDAVDPAVVR